VDPAFDRAKSDRDNDKSGAAPPWKRSLKFFVNPWLQIALNALIVTASELFLKLGARETAHFRYAFSWTGVAGLASPWTWLGILFVILSLVTWLHILRQVPLSVAFPLSNVVHVLVPLTSWIFLHELISPRRWLGIALVLVGLAIVAKPFARIEEKL
jgi:drug/metabolite transporter (DMT)-like permease